MSTPQEKPIKKLSKLDISILRAIQKDCKKPLEKIANEIDIPSSTIYYRLKQMEKNNIIRGYYADLNPAKLGRKYSGIVSVRAKYGPHYHEIVGRKLSDMKEISKLFFVWGDWDFLAIVNAIDNEDLLRIMDRIINMDEIERTSTQIVSRVIKDNPPIEL